MLDHILGSGNSQKGTAVVEFSIVIPLLLTLLFGIIEFSLLVYNKHIITNASREGARAGIVYRMGGTRLNETAIEDVIANWLTNDGADFLVTFGSATLTSDGIDVCSQEEGTTTWTCPNNTSSKFGDRLRVTISYDYDFLIIPRLVTDLAGGITISAETIMNYE